MPPVCSVFRNYCNHFAPGVHSSSEATPGQALHQGILVGVRSLPCCLPVAQFKSLREVCMGLASCESPLQHLGISETFSESTPGVCHANRPWQLYQTVFTQLLGRCQAEVAARGCRRKSLREQADEPGRRHPRSVGHDVRPGQVLTNEGSNQTASAVGPLRLPRRSLTRQLRAAVRAKSERTEPQSM
jgi:hypothetical protein